jgi:phage major head subunit gpT-like protein
MALDTAVAVAALRDLTATFDRTVEAANPFYPEITTRVNSTGADEKYGWLGAMPGMREWLGDRKFHELRGTTYELANKHWESSVLVRKTDIADSRMVNYGPLITDLANEATHHPDELVSTVVVNGESSAGHDGQFFFDTDHSWGDSGSQSNDLTYDVTTTSAPTATEFRAAFRQSVTALLGFKNDRGKPMIRPLINGLNNLIVMIPPNMRDAATEAFESQIISNSSNVVIDRPRIVTNSYLTNQTKFYTFYTGGALRPFVFQAREPLSRQVQDIDNIKVKHAAFMTEARYNVGYLAWWYAALTTLT